MGTPSQLPAVKTSYTPAARGRWRSVSRQSPPCRMSSRYGNSDYNPLHITSFLFIANRSRKETKLSKIC